MATISPMQSKHPWDNDFAVMGIINATDDSFSGDGIGKDINAGVTQAMAMLADGAKILDIGGVSTRRFSLYYGEKSSIADPAEEMKNVVPLLKAIRKETNAYISIDTADPTVAKAALDEGVRMINYVWGDNWDDSLLDLAKAYKATICLMHNSIFAEHPDVVQEVHDFLQTKGREAEQRGIPTDHIVIDPGIGFKKNVSDNLRLLNQLEILTSLPYSVLLGVSRKSVIWKTLSITPQESVEGSLAIHVMGLEKGVKVFRTHDVKQTVQALTMAQAVISS